jgi:hypothetical protein
LATVYNALFLGGGPGKMKVIEIELIRNNKIYLISINFGQWDQSENVGLKDNDVIRIPAYNQGYFGRQVKRPGIFEMKPGESFLIYYHSLQVLSLPIQHQ